MICYRFVCKNLPLKLLHMHELACGMFSTFKVLDVRLLEAVVDWRWKLIPKNILGTISTNLTFPRIRQKYLLKYSIFFIIVITQ